jgi:hypothetical protein
MLIWSRCAISALRTVSSVLNLDSSFLTNINPLLETTSISITRIPILMHLNEEVNVSPTLSPLQLAMNPTSNATRLQQHISCDTLLTGDRHTSHDQ